jgi:rubrerythrin
MSHKDLTERASRMAIPSSGDDAADQKALLDAALHQARMDENICPNGCGPMVWDDPNNRHCPVCNFHGWCNVPYSGAKQA